MTQYACYRICQRGTDFLGTVEAESKDEAESMAYERWCFDEDAGEYLDVEEDDDDDRH